MMQQFVVGATLFALASHAQQINTDNMVSEDGSEIMMMDDLPLLDQESGMDMMGQSMPGMGNDDHSGHMDKAGAMDHSSQMDHEKEEHEEDHEGHGSGTHMMPMYFWTGTEIIFLIHGFDSKDSAGYALGWFVTFFLAIFVEILILVRSYLQAGFQQTQLKLAVDKPIQMAPISASVNKVQDANRVQIPLSTQIVDVSPGPERKFTVKLSWCQRTILALLLVMISFLAFSVMLIVMTFEVGLLFSATLGLAIGNLACSFVTTPKLPEGAYWLKPSNHEPNPDPCCSMVAVPQKLRVEMQVPQIDDNSTEGARGEEAPPTERGLIQ